MKMPPRKCRSRASPTRAPAPTCSIRPARRGGRKACASRCTGLPIDAPNPLLVLVQGSVRVQRRHDLSLARAALSRGATALFMTVHRGGGTVVVMEHFDAETALKRIEQYKANASQWVPTMFVTHAQAARRCASEIRCVVDEVCDPCGSTMPRRRQAPDDRMVGPGDPRILCRHRRQRPHAIRAAPIGWRMPARSARRSSASCTSATRTATKCRSARKGAIYFAGRLDVPVS